MTRAIRWSLVLLLMAAGAAVQGSRSGTARALGIASPHPGRVARAARCPRRNPQSGTVTVGQSWTSWQALNPFSNGPSAEASPIFQLLFDIDNRGRLFPELAASIPTGKNGGLRDGGRTIVVHLKRGLQWSNGAEITSTDVQFGWQVEDSPPLRPIVGCILAACDLISKIDTPDRYTAVVHLKHPYASALSAAMPVPWPVRWPGAWNRDPRAAALKLARDPSFNFLGPGFPTDGPFQVVRAEGDQRAILHPMKYYSVMTCGASLKNLVYLNASTPTQLTTAMDKRRADLVDTLLPSLSEVEKHRLGYHVHVAPSTLLEHLELNLDPTYNGKPNPLHDVRVRQALALAIDKQTLAHDVFGLTPQQARETLLWSILINTPHYRQAFADPAIRGQWDPLAHRYDANTGRGQALADAKRLLASTRWKRGFTLDFFTTQQPVRQALANGIAADWAKLGVKIAPSFVPLATLTQDDWAHGGIGVHGAFQVMLFAYNVGPDPDPLKYYFESRYVDRLASTHDPNNANFAGIRDRTIDHAFETAATSLSTSVRRTQYRVVQGRVNQMAYWIPLETKPFVYAENGRIQNLSPSVVGAWLYWNTWAWKTGKH